MNGKQTLCPDCGGGMKFGGFKVTGTSQIVTGFGCNFCGTVTQHFGTLDVSQPVAA